MILVEYDKMRSYLMSLYNISLQSLYSNSKRAKVTSCGLGYFAHGQGKWIYYFHNIYSFYNLIASSIICMQAFLRDSYRTRFEQVLNVIRTNHSKHFLKLVELIEVTVIFIHGTRRLFWEETKNYIHHYLIAALL